MIEYEESKIFSEKESWRVAKRTQGKQVIHCSAVELDMMYFKTPWMWSSLFRLSEFNKVLFVSSVVTTNNLLSPELWILRSLRCLIK
mgnify:FL=1